LQSEHFETSISKTLAIKAAQTSFRGGPFFSLRFFSCSNEGMQSQMHHLREAGLQKPFTIKQVVDLFDRIRAQSNSGSIRQ